LQPVTGHLFVTSFPTAITTTGEPAASIGDNVIIIAASVGGGGALILLMCVIAIIVFVCCCRNKDDSGSKGKYITNKGLSSCLPVGSSL
jgi:hypothetical protein